jgi:hypothetical protein
MNVLIVVGAAEAATIVAVETAPVLGGALGPKGRIFGKGGWLNANRYLRVGWSRFGGRLVFRVAGKVVEWFAESGHWDIFKGGPL